MLGVEKSPCLPETKAACEEAICSKLDLTALASLAKHNAGPGFKCGIWSEQSGPCRKSREAGTRCEKRLEDVELEQEFVESIMMRQPARPALTVLPRHPELFRKAAQGSQDCRDFDWDILTQFSIYGCGFFWTCDCGGDEEEEEEEEYFGWVDYEYKTRMMRSSDPSN